MGRFTRQSGTNRSDRTTRSGLLVRRRKSSPRGDGSIQRQYTSLERRTAKAGGLNGAECAAEGNWGGSAGLLRVAMDEPGVILFGQASVTRKRVGVLIGGFPQRVPSVDTDRAAA